MCSSLRDRSQRLIDQRELSVGYLIGDRQQHSPCVFGNPLSGRWGYSDGTANRRSESHIGTTAQDFTRRVEHIHYRLQPLRPSRRRPDERRTKCLAHSRTARSKPQVRRRAGPTSFDRMAWRSERSCVRLVPGGVEGARQSIPAERNRLVRSRYRSPVGALALTLGSRIAKINGSARRKRSCIEWFRTTTSRLRRTEARLSDCEDSPCYQLVEIQVGRSVTTFRGFGRKWGASCRHPCSSSSARS